MKNCNAKKLKQEYNINWLKSDFFAKYLFFQLGEQDIKTYKSLIMKRHYTSIKCFKNSSGDRANVYEFVAQKLFHHGSIQRQSRLRHLFP